jgi:DNA-binding GntR family transcriptional regulator
MAQAKNNVRAPALNSLPYRRGLFDKATLSDRVYEALRGDILANRLPPGTPLQEEALAQALEVSRGPVREAIRRLAAEGLADLMPRRRATVSSLSPAEFLNAYQVREALEVLAIRLAVPRLAPGDLAELQAHHRAMLAAAAAEDADTFFEANAAFHSLFVRCSGNPVLQELYDPLVDQMRRYRLRSLALRGGMQRSCEEHWAILAAVERASADEAAQLLSEHIQMPQRILAAAEDQGELELAAREPAPGGAG